MAVRRSFLPLVFLAAALAGCEPAPPRQALDRDELATQLGQLASVGAEAALFTQEVAAGHLNSSYPWVHQQALASQAARVADALGQPAPPALRPLQQDAVALAARLQLELTRVAGARHDPGELQALGQRFAALRSQARALGAAP